MARVPKKWQGLHPNRYGGNPLERKFAAAWAEINNDNRGVSTLAYLLCTGDQHDVKPPSDRDRQVACTVIQWLGSVVGERWVRDVLRLPEITAEDIEFLESQSPFFSADRKRMRALIKKLNRG